MKKEDFVKRLRELRHAKGVSARAMSLAIGQSPNYINSIERSRNLPSMKVFFAICKYLNIIQYGQYVITLVIFFFIKNVL